MYNWTRAILENQSSPEVTYSRGRSNLPQSTVKENTSKKFTRFYRKEFGNEYLMNVGILKSVNDNYPPERDNYQFI